MRIAEGVEAGRRAREDKAFRCTVPQNEGEVTEQIIGEVSRAPFAIGFAYNGGQTSALIKVELPSQVIKLVDSTNSDDSCCV